MKLTVAVDVVSDLFHCRTDRFIRPKQHVVLAGIPFGERWDFLRDGGEETHDDANRSGFHVVAKLLDHGGILSDSQLKFRKLRREDSGNEEAKLTGLR